MQSDDPEALAQAVAIIRRGGVVAVPTETFYGLAADATHQMAVARIFEIKGRPAGMALPLVAGSLAQVVDLLGPLDAATARAAHAFWPGPLSLVLTATARLSAAVGQADNRDPAAGGFNIAVRVPGHAFVRALALGAGTLLTATSANATGEPPAETAQQVIAALGGRVDLVIDGGPTPGGMPSTIADLRGVEPRLIRDGAAPWPHILEVLRVS
jgi:L-threonylcarbamoyladenylate synthase